MIKLIPVSHEADQNTRAELESVTGISDVEKFIFLFNEGMYDSKNEKIKHILDEISATYRNIDSNKKYISIISEEESAITSIEELIKHWKFICSLKSLATQLIQEGYPDYERIIFEEKQGGFPNLVDPKDNSKFRRHWSNKSIATNYRDEIATNPFLAEIIEDYSDNNDESIVAFPISVVSQIDDSFVLDIRDFIIQSAKEAKPEQ